MRDGRSPDVDGRPRVLGVRVGVNPNSSSLGVDVTYLMFGGTLAFALSLVLGAWLRGRRPKLEEIGRPEADPGAPGSGGPPAAS